MRPPVPHDPAVDARIRARKVAEAAWELLREASFERGLDMPAFWQRVGQLAAAKGLIAPPDNEEQIKPMSEEECVVFGKIALSFGAFKGERVRDVSFAYLCQLTDPSSPVSQFIAKLKSYLRNPHIKRMIEEET